MGRRYSVAICAAALTLIAAGMVGLVGYEKGRARCDIVFAPEHYWQAPSRGSK